MTDKGERPRDTAQARAGRRAALLLAGTGVFWIIAIFAGNMMDWPTRIRALFDLIALAGFGLALWLTYQARKAGRND
jgi:uncharacterized membrane protein